MSKPIIEIENICKRYRIGATRAPYLSLREELANKTRHISSSFTRILSNGQMEPSSKETDFWALSDVSFPVQEGEAIGIIGRNGAGKSTLLKILSQITPPTKGRIIMRGRVASLLEVGTGFHQELTGRENIFLNGAILGMTRVEIRRKFDEIVAFSEVEKFLDTPVKHYSSGMYVRLAFAVAAHLEPEILVVDEVLAVGDAEFQKKCLGKMEEVGKAGRTVLFVSHNMGMISHLCKKAILLDKGLIVKEGDVEEVVSYYINNHSTGNGNIYKSRDTESMIKDMCILEANTVDNSFNVISDYKIYDPVMLSIILKINKCPKDVLLGVSVKDHRGRKVFTTERPLGSSAMYKSNTNISIKIKIPANILVPGVYSFKIGLHIPNIQIIDCVEDVCKFTIVDTGSDLSMYDGTDYGCVFVKCDWEFQANI